jgi:ABC-type metal ion transport system, ATPase component
MTSSVLDQNVHLATVSGQSGGNSAAASQASVSAGATPEKDNLVLIENVSKVFPASRSRPAVTALENINLAVRRGSITAIIGRSGAGKSTLIRLVNGLEKATSGRVVVNGTDVMKLSEVDLRNVRRSIGMIFQHFNLLSSRTVFDNVALPLEIAGLKKQEIAQRILPLLELVGLADKHNRYPAELSGGQKQRVGIARALATQPMLLLSDEATSALDPETTQSVLELLSRINRELGLTILLITHEMEVVKRIADYVAVIDAGRIVEQGGTFEVFSAPKHPTTRKLLSGIPGMQLPGYVQAHLTDKPAATSKTVMRILFAGPHATEPILASLATEFGVRPNIMGGAVDEIAGRPFGTLIVSFPADEQRLTTIRQFLADRGLITEILGYVA